NGDVGDGTTTERHTPTQTSSLGVGRTATAIALGSGHSCVILDDGAVSCWGANNGGSLGDGTTISKNTPTLVVNLAEESGSSAVTPCPAGTYQDSTGQSSC
ncbi:MAG: RCC1 repeat-containing protein, partial [Candidatus Thalassarchaeaceae archaeon]